MQGTEEEAVMEVSETEQIAGQAMRAELAMGITRTGEDQARSLRREAA